MNKKRLLWTAVLASCLLTIISCDSGSDDSAPSNITDTQRRAVVDDLTAWLDERGYDVAEGTPFFFRPDDCKVLPNCFSNNATTPYGLFNLPVSEWEQAESDLSELDRFPEGQSNHWRLRPDEAILFLGRTPPPAKYFSFRSYLFSRLDESKGDRVKVFASLGDSLNHVNMNTSNTLDGADGNPFDAETAVIVASESVTDRLLRDGLAAAGVAEAMVNTDRIPGQAMRMGLQPEDDNFMMLYRIALFDDPVAGDAYMNNPPFILLRITPREAQEVALYPLPEVMPKGTGTNEDALLPAVEELEEAITERYSEYEGQAIGTIFLGLEGLSCVENMSECLGDVRDAIYGASVNLDLTLPEDDSVFYVAYGVNHSASGKATYSNVVVTERERFRGFDSFESPDMPGSAGLYIPNHPDADKVYAMKLARSCGGEDYCIEVPTEWPGISGDDPMRFMFRAYVEPGLEVSPSRDEMIIDRVLRFERAE